MPDHNLETISKKLDKILAYHRREQLWRWVRSITSLVLFIVFVGIPIYYGYQLVKDPSILLQYIDLPKITDLQKEIEAIMNQVSKSLPSQ